MTIRLSFYLVIFVLLTAASPQVSADNTPLTMPPGLTGQNDMAEDSAWLIAQEETPEKKPGTRPPLPRMKAMKKMHKGPTTRPGLGSSRIKPIKPVTRSGDAKGSKLKRPGLRPFDKSGKSIKPIDRDTGKTRKLRDPAKDSAKDPEAKDDPESSGKSKISTKEKKCKPLPPYVRVTMNFNEAEVLEIVQWISKQTCKNFIIGDGIRGGKITILSNTQVTANEAYRAFLSALNVNNMTVVKVGQFYKIQMKREAAKDTIPTYIGEEVDIPALDQMVTRVLQLKYVDANTINGTVKQLTTKDGDSYPYAPTNTLIISDTGNNMHRLMEILTQLDTPLGQEEIRIIQVEYAEATELAQTLEEIFGDKGGGRRSSGSSSKSHRIQPVRAGKGKTTSPQQGGGGSGEETVTLSKVISDERTNKIILVAPARAFPKIQNLIKQLDVPIPGEGQIQVVYLQHADAEELSSTLTSLAQGTSGRPKIGGSKGKSKAGKSGSKKAAELFQGEVKVTADQATNSLVIVASQNDYKSLYKVIKKLDIRRRQVFVEAVIMEVNIDTTKDTGLTFHTGAAPTIGGETIPLFFGTQFKSQGSNFNSLAPNISMLGFLSGLRGPELAGEDSILAGISIPAFGVMLQALQTDSNVNVLSTPHILTSDNEEAEIKVGENIPIPGGYGGGMGGMSSLSGLASMAGLSGAATGTTGGFGRGLGGLGGMLGMGMGAINRQEVGLTLKIKPQINEGNVIRLELEEELSEVKDTSNPLGPTTTQRSAKTVVEVQDQQTVVIGGLIREKIDIGETKVPVLGDIPVIGWLFRSKRTQKTKTNLLLFLTPHVISGPEDFRAIFKRKMEERREFLERFHGKGPEYKAFVDFRKRRGPLADIHIVLRKELNRIENGGPGEGDEIVITPDNPASSKIKPIEESTEPAATESDSSKGPAETESTGSDATETVEETTDTPDENRLEVE
jgi:general secretion pathway protein D